MVFVPQKAADVFEKWLSRHGSLSVRRYFSSALVDLINIIRLDSLNHASLAAAPENFECHAIGERASGEHPDIFIRRKIATATNHFLGLRRHGAASQREPGSDSASVRSPSLEADGHARGA